MIFFRKDDNKDIDSEKEAAMEAEIKAARERAIVPLEARMKQFKDMLLERGVREICGCLWGEKGRGGFRQRSQFLANSKLALLYVRRTVPLLNRCIWYETPYFRECFSSSRSSVK